jgi:GT2 family glycosyltransferase
VSVRVSVVVVTCDGGALLEEGLEALASSRVPAGGREILLVENGPRRASARHTTGVGAEVRRLGLGRNRGFAGGISAAAEAAQGDILVLVNDDAIAEAETVCRLTDALEAAPDDVAAVTGVLTDATGDRIDYYDGIVTFDGHALQRRRGAALSSVELAAGERLFPCGGLMAVRRGLFCRLGGFDERYFAYYEDVDFGWRATLAGFRTLFVPEARARHVSGATGERLGLETRGVLFETNAFATAYANLGERALQGLLPAIVWTFLQRARDAVLAHGSDAERVLADPFGGLELHPPPLANREPSSWTSWLRRAFHWRGRRRIEVDHPYALMWGRALSRLVALQAQLVEKRARTQALRRVPDEHLLRLYPLHLVPTYPGDEALFASALFQAMLPAWPGLVATRLEDV